MSDKYGGMNYSPIKPSKPLSEELYLFRTGRPDEWTMQEFGRNAVWLEQKLQQVERERDEALARLAEAEKMLSFAHRARDWPHDNEEFWGRVKLFLANQNTDKE